MKRYVAIGADHGGFSMKTELISWLLGRGYEVLDKGAHALDPADDYPDFAGAVAAAVASGQAQRGILVCGSGVGSCITANKEPIIFPPSSSTIKTTGYKFFEFL